LGALENGEDVDLHTLALFDRKILINVWELYEEANWLYQHGHYARAYALAHLSFEETAKTTVLTYLAMDIFAGRTITPETIQELFSSNLFINHSNKLRIAFLKLPNIDFQETVKQTRGLNQFKNKSLYADILDGEMFKPSDFFGEKQAVSMLGIALNTLSRWVEELGETDLDNISNIAVETIENHYKEMKVVFDQLEIKPSATTSVGFIDYLRDVIKNEELYNLVKTSMIRDSTESTENKN